jgi:uncharacterized membrane protein
MEGERYFKDRIPNMERQISPYLAGMAVRIVLILSLLGLLVGLGTIGINYVHSHPDASEVREFCNQRLKELINEKISGNITEKEFNDRVRKITINEVKYYLRFH